MKKNNHGGSREGAGRKPGVKKPERKQTLQIRLAPLAVQKMDAERGEDSRGVWIEKKIMGIEEQNNE